MSTGNRTTGAEAVVRLLQGYGVRHVFGLCGDTTLPLYDALARLDHGITHVLTRDERSAGYMADGYARITGRVGVCEGPSGGGATYVLPALAEANESSVPVLALNSDIATVSRGRFALTALDQPALFRPVTKWNASIDTAAAIPGHVRRAFREMTTGRPGVVHLALPFNTQTDVVDEDSVSAESGFDAVPANRPAPDAAAVDAATALIAEARRPVIICGGGVLISGAEAALATLAERTGAIVATSISGKGAIADSHPLALGVVGSNGGTPETRAVVSAADLAIFVGCRAGSVTTERWRHPAPGSGRVIHIDVDDAVFGANYVPDVVLQADARRTLAALAVAWDRRGVRPQTDGAAAVRTARQAKYAAFAARADSDEVPIRPERLVAALQATLPEDAIIVADAGTPCPYLAAYLTQTTPGRRVISNRGHGALGYALPAAVGVQYGRPNARVVAAMGDGSFGFCCGELETLVRLNVPITMIVVSNATYGWIKAGQKSGYAGRYFGVDFGRGDHARIAAAFGVASWRVEDPGTLDSALRAAIAHDGPALVDVVCQPLHEGRPPVSEWVA